MKRRQQPEAAIQRAVLAHLKARAAPNTFAFAVPMGGIRSRVEAAIFRGLGSKAGIPDLIIIKSGRVYGLELKAEGGKVTPVQAETIAQMELAGCTCAVAVGLDQALAVLEGWGILRGKAA